MLSCHPTAQRKVTDLSTDGKMFDHAGRIWTARYSPDAQPSNDLKSPSIEQARNPKVAVLDVLITKSK